MLPPSSGAEVTRQEMAYIGLEKQGMREGSLQAGYREGSGVEWKKMEAACFSETSTPTHKSTRLQNPKLKHNSRHENLKSHEPLCQHHQIINIKD
jgi:hypothetical protein